MDYLIVAGLGSRVIREGRGSRIMRVAGKLRVSGKRIPKLTHANLHATRHGELLPFGGNILMSQSNEARKDLSKDFSVFRFYFFFKIFLLEKKKSGREIFCFVWRALTEKARGSKDGWMICTFIWQYKIEEFILKGFTESFYFVLNCLAETSTRFSIFRN